MALELRVTFAKIVASIEKLVFAAWIYCILIDILYIDRYIVLNNQIHIELISIFLNISVSILLYSITIPSLNGDHDNNNNNNNKYYILHLIFHLDVLFCKNIIVYSQYN